MPTLVVKNLSELLHERLKAQAVQHHRSVTKEAISLIEQGLLATPRREPLPLPSPVKLASGPVTTKWILAAIAEGRD